MKKALTSSATNALLICSGTPMVAEPLVHPKVRTRRVAMLSPETALFDSPRQTAVWRPKIIISKPFTSYRGTSSAVVHAPGRRQRKAIALCVDVLFVFLHALFATRPGIFACTKEVETRRWQAHFQPLCFDLFFLPLVVALLSVLIFPPLRCSLLTPVLPSIACFRLELQLSWYSSTCPGSPFERGGAESPG